MSVIRIQDYCLEDRSSQRVGFCLSFPILTTPFLFIIAQGRWIITDKYIGIKHLFNGDNFDGADCIGLCRLFYKEHGWKQDFKDGNPVTREWQTNDPGRLFRYLKRNFVETEKPEELTYGDIVLFKINGDYHLGIYLEYGKVLAMEVPYAEGKTMSTIYRSHFWRPFFVRGFKR